MATWSAPGSQAISDNFLFTFLPYFCSVYLSFSLSCNFFVFAYLLFPVYFYFWFPFVCVFLFRVTFFFPFTFLSSLFVHLALSFVYLIRSPILFSPVFCLFVRPFLSLQSALWVSSSSCLALFLSFPPPRPPHPDFYVFFYLGTFLFSLYVKVFALCP